MRLFAGRSILKREFGGGLPVEALELLRQAIKPALLRRDIAHGAIEEIPLTPPATS